MNPHRMQVALILIMTIFFVVSLSAPAVQVTRLAGPDVHPLSALPVNTVTTPSLTPLSGATRMAGCAAASPLSLAYLPNSTFISEILALPDGSFLLRGNIDNNDGTWLARMDSAGTLAWQKVYGSRMGQVHLAANGNIVLEFRQTNLEIGLDGNVIQALGVPWYHPNANGTMTVINGTKVAQYKDLQTPLWQVEIKNFGGLATTTSDGGALFAYAGSYADTSVYYAPIYTDIKVIKILPTGQAVQRVYGRLVGDEMLEYLRATGDGGALLAGTHYYEQLGSETDLWLMKVNASGGISWQTTLMLSPYGETLRYMHFLNKGYLAEIATVDRNDTLLVRLTPGGSLQWQKFITSSRGEVTISAAADTAEGGLLLAGYTWEKTEVYWLAKLDSKGRLVWEKTIGYDLPGSPGSEVKAILPLANKTILLGGLTNQSGDRLAGQFSSWIAQIPDAGQTSGLLLLLPGKMRATTTLGSRPATLKDEIIPGADASLKEVSYSAVDTSLTPFAACLPPDAVFPTPLALPSLTPSATPTTAVTPTPALARELYLTNPPMQGDDVLQLQKRLYELGYTEIGARDGIFGRLTDAAVRRFQTKNDLVVDGIVGPKTWKRLFSQDAVGVGK